ncbi:hypothetical protein QC823_04210 [Halomonas vilamensis]|uniref:Acyltransferase 3 domain-containing protein n=1 Tax=Vreelandella vilamensis TaxID=531309 RepID=A0ABU1H3F6_9GAMM|nr:acyltransferase family protein [Halomonas vilamensis]MDR5898197.1 hypothetical protein [Halomonas vilamensis]
MPLFLLFTLWMMKCLKGRRAPPLVRRLNEFSFGIYLAHPMFFNLVDLLGAGERLSPMVYALVLVVVGMLGSVGWNLIANRWQWGGLLFGKRMQIA